MVDDVIMVWCYVVGEEKIGLDDEDKWKVLSFGTHEEYEGFYKDFVARMGFATKEQSRKLSSTKGLTSGYYLVYKFKK